MDSEQVPTVVGLQRFPVKSMLGEALRQCHVSTFGLLGDRGYALIDRSDGVVASAKNPRKWGGLLGFHATFVDEPEPDRPLPPVRITFPDGTVRRSDAAGTDAALSAALGRDVHLTGEAPEGKAFEEVWPDIEGLAPQRFIDGTAVGRADSGEVLSRIPLGSLAPASTFVDVSVLHLLTTATLARLTALAPEADFDVRRYRPNVLVDVPGEWFAEDEWVGGTVGIGDGVQAAVTMSTMRCVMTTLVQDGVPADRQTLRTIAAHNRRDVLGLGTWACAGVYADVAAGGTISVGDRVTPPAL